MGYFGFLHVNQPESPDTRGIDDRATKTQREHFCKRGGMLSRVMGIRNLRYFQAQTRFDTIDQ